MDVIEAKPRSNIDRGSIAAAILACICNLATLVLLSYQDYLRTNTLVTNYPEMVSDGFLLTPLIVVIIFRHVAAVTLIYALILSVVLGGRIYYLVQFHLIGITALEPKLDWPGLLLILLSTTSLLVLLIWGMIRLTALISSVLKRNRANING